MTLRIFEGKLGRHITIEEDATSIITILDDGRIQARDGFPIDKEFFKLAILISENFDFYWERGKWH